MVSEYLCCRWTHNIMVSEYLYCRVAYSVRVLALVDGHKWSQSTCRLTHMMSEYLYCRLIHNIMVSEYLYCYIDTYGVRVLVLLD